MLNFCVGNALSYSWRQQGWFRGAAIFLGGVQLVFPPLAFAQTQQQIIVDGNTQTNLSVNGNVTDVTTGTIAGSSGLNSFSVFDVYTGNTVNMHLPNGANSLINFVHDKQTNIDGVLNGYKQGKIDGDVYFLNPHGVVIGQSGVVNVGTFYATTPTPDFMRNMFSAPGVINPTQFNQITSNGVPLSRDGLIAVRGTLNAMRSVDMQAGAMDVSGTVTTGAAAQFNAGQLVNLDAVSVDLSNAPSVTLSATTNINITGAISADGSDNQNAGDVDIRAGGTITTGAGADISASGVGANSDGGDVIIFADDTAVLGAGSVLRADGGASGDGGFVEFSAVGTVELAGGSLSAAASNGVAGSVLIDPDNITISSSLLRNSSASGGTNDNNTSWNAGSLTLQAADTIRLSSNVTVSSRQVANQSSDSDHRTGASTGASGDITLQSQNIIMENNSMITAHGDSGYNGGAVVLDAGSSTDASIDIDGGQILGKSITLDVDALRNPSSNYASFSSSTSAIITIDNGSTIGNAQTDNVTITATALQGKPGIADGVVINTDIRNAVATVNLNGVSITAANDVTVASDSTIQTDMSNSGWGQLGTLLPLSIGVAMTSSRATTVMDGTSSITSTAGAVTLASNAVTQSTIFTQANSLGAAVVGAISVTENDAVTDVSGSADITAAGDVRVSSRGKSQITTAADASAASAANVSGSIAVGIGLLRDNTSTSVMDNASIQSTGGAVSITADSQVQSVFAARAGYDDNFTATAKNKFNSAIDDQTELNQSFMGLNPSSMLKTGAGEVIDQLSTSMSPGGDGSGGAQLAGAFVYADVQNDTNTIIGVADPALSAAAPTVTADDNLTIRSRAITQSQSFATGRTDNSTFGGSAGVAVQKIANRMATTVSGSDLANVNLTADNISIAALTEAYEDNITATNRFGVYGASGVGTGSDDSIGLSGAVAIGINNTNDVTAELGDNTTTTATNDVAVEATNITETKVKADGSKTAVEASGRFMAVLKEETPVESVITTSKQRGKLGLGASIAVAITENTATAKVASGANVTAGDNLTVQATQTGSTESEARAAGGGGIAIIPLAAVTVARNTSLAEISSGVGVITATGGSSVRSDQTVTSTAVGNGAAEASGQSNKVAIGMSAGLVIGFDNNTARVARDATVGGIDVIANTSHTAMSGAESSAQVVEPELIEDAEEDESEPDPLDNSSNSTEEAVDGMFGLSNGLSGKAVNVDVVKDRLSTDFGNASGGGTSLGDDDNSEDGKKIAIAGAFGVTYAESRAVAEIADNVTITAGANAVTVAALKNADITATGEASTGGSDYNIGGGLGVNIAKASNKARIADGAVVSSGDLAVTAGMLTQLDEDNATDSVNTITSYGSSGAGTGKLAIAGALALNIVLENDTAAEIETGATLDNVSGNIAIGAVSNNNYDADSLATVGKTAALFGGIDAALGGLHDITVWTDNLQTNFSNMLQTAVNEKFAESASTSAAPGGDEGGGDDDDGGFGIGAGISINAIVRDKTIASLSDNVTINNAAESLSVTTSATTTMKTHAEAGAKHGSGGDPKAKTSLDAAVSVGVLIKDADAYVGSGSTISVSDNITITSTVTTTSKSTAKGEVSATDTAVGASVAVGVVLEDNDAYLGRSMSSSGGAFALRADSDSSDIVLADAVAAGAALDKYTNKLGVSKSDLLGGSSQPTGEKSPTSMEALGGDFSGGKGASFDTTGSATDAGGKGGDAKKSGSINIAASVAVSWADHDARAKVGEGVSVTSANDLDVIATNDVQYRTRGSGMAVFSDKAIGVGVGILATSQNTEASIGNNASLTTTAANSDIEVSATTSENQGNDPDNASIPFGTYASAEGIAGAGGGDIGIAGSLALVYSDDEQFVNVGTGSVISARRNVDINSSATNKIVSRAWAMALASSATCDDPGNCNSNGDRTAVGASIAVNLVLDNNSATIGEDTTISGDNVTIAAKDLSPNNAAFTLDPEDENNTTETYIQANYTADLQNTSYYAEAIAGAGAQDGNAIGGSLAFTMSLGKTEAIIGEGVNITAVEDIDVDAYNESDARHLVGALAISSGKKAVGASISGIYLREDVQVTIGAENGTDNATVTRLTADGSIDVDANADQSVITMMAAGGVSTNDVAAAGAFGFNVMDTDVEARITEDAVLQATTGSLGVSADSTTNIRNFGLAVSGSGGGNSVGGSLVLNLFLTDKQAIIGSSTSADNNIALNAATSVNIGVNAKQEIMNGIISASVSTSDNAISGALSSNVIKGDSKALVRRGANINDNSSLNSTATSQTVGVYANDNTTLTDLTGTLAASNNTSVGIALGANVMWKAVEASVDSTVIADGNIGITADTAQDLTATVVGIAGSSGGLAGAGSVSFGLVKTTTDAYIKGNADLTTSGSVKLHAGDDTDIFMLEPAASFSTGGNALAGAVGAAVFLGRTKARIEDGAAVTAYGNSTMSIETVATQTSSPLLEGLSSGGDNDTRDALGDFNDNFTFDNVKDLFLTESRVTETKRGVSVTAVADQDVISIAASGAVSSDNAIAISLSAGVGVGTTEASIGDATINSSIAGAHDDQDVTVRGISDTYWVDLSAALGVGTGTAGVGVGGDVVVQVKDTSAFIADGATVKANRNVEVAASSKDKIVNSAATIGVGNSAGVAGTAAVGVLVNTTNAYIDGTVTAEDNLTVESKGNTELIQIAGAVGGGGTAGVGASFGVAVVKGSNIAYIGDNATTDAGGTTSVIADTDETSIAAVLAGGIGGTVGVSVSGGIKVHDSVTRAYIYGDVNQNYTSGFANQDVVVKARNEVTTIDVTGGIGGGGTVGVGVTLNALVVHNKAQAWIGGGTSTAVSAQRDVSVVADSNKTTKNFTVAGAAGGTVSVAGNVAVVLVGAQADEETDSQMTGDGNNLGDESDSRQNSLSLSNILNDDNSSGDYSRTGDDYATVGTEIDSRQSQTNVGAKFNNTSDTTSLNQTKAYIANGATVTSGRDVTVEAKDVTNSIYTGGALGGAGVVGVGVTVGVMIVNNTAEAFIGNSAQVNATRNTLVKARTSEDVNSAALSAGGAGITSVQGTVMAQVTRSTTRAYIADNASINQSDNGTTAQSVAVLAESKTNQLTVSGSGGGALVGVGITGDTLVLEKETTAYIGDDAQVRSGGDVTVDANASADLLQIALSINGGLVGVTGAAGVTVANNNTSASIGDRAVVFAEDSMRVQATDDTEIDAIVITGAGGVVGVSGSVGVYVVKSSTAATIGDNATITALAEAAGDGLSAISGTVDNSSTSIVTKSTRDRDNNSSSDNFTVTAASFDNQTVRGLSVAAMTYEDVNFAPIGVAGGLVGVAGVVATTVTQSTTKAEVGNGTTINNVNTGAGANQDVRLLAASETSLNNISAGMGGGAVGVTFDFDTQVFKKSVSARMLGDATAVRDVRVSAKSTDRVYQTAASIAIGGDASGGIVAVSVIADDVKAEIGDNSTVIAGDDVTVDSTQNINMYQTTGNIAGGIGGNGIGASLGVLVARSTNIARIGNGANVTARDNLTVMATTANSLNQNVIGFSGGMGAAISGSIGINVFKTSTTAEIGDNATINQTAGYDNNSGQSVDVIATESVTTQGAAGAVAVGGGVGAGIGLTTTVTRNTVKARIGNGVVLSARSGVAVRADTTKNISNQGVAFAAGGIAGAAGSVALSLIGGGMSDNASDTLSNDNGNMMADADTEVSGSRKRNDNSDNSSAKNNTNAYAGSYDNETDTLVQNETSGLQNDVEGTGGDSTLAEIGANSTFTVGGDVSVVAEETLNLSQVSGGASGGAVGLGGFVAVADYNGSVTARIGDNTRIDNVTSLRVDATVNSGDDIVINVPGSDNITVKAVNSTVVGASVGIVGLAASIAQVNLAENATATIGDNVTVTMANDNASVTVDAMRDVDAEVNVVGVAGGVVAAGISYAGLTTTGNAIANIGSDVTLGTNSGRMGDAVIRARNNSTQTARAVSAGAGLYGALVGAIVKVDDAGTTMANIGSDSAIYASGSLSMSSDDTAENDAQAVGIAVSGGIGLGIISSKVNATRAATTTIGDNATLIANGVTVTSKVGAAGRKFAKSDVTGASGGALVGVTGSESIVTSSADSRVTLGNGVEIRSHLLSGSNEVEGNDVTITATNLASASNNTNAFAFGTAALGVHVTRTNQSGNAQITTGDRFTLNSKRNATISTLSDRDTRTTSVAGAGGAIAATGGEAITNHVSNSMIRIGDGTSSANGADFDIADNLTLDAENTDTYDGSIDAGAVALAGVTGAKLRSTGSAATLVDLGDYADIDTHNLTINSTNQLEKTGLGDNFLFAGGGAISVTVGNSRASQAQSSRINVGRFADIYATGSRTDKGAITLTASNRINAEDSSKLNTGALIGVPVSDTAVTATANAKVLFDDNATVRTQRGDVTITADATSSVIAKSKTSVWGLAGVGATAKSTATVTNSNDVTFDNGSTLIANGYLYVNAGKKLSGKTVTADTDIYNNTLIAGIFGEKADATLNDTSTININGNASVKSARHMNLKAHTGSRNVSGDGFKEWLQFIGIAVVPLTGDFGRSRGSSTGKIKVDGNLETGVYNTQYIGFGKDFSAGDNISVGVYSDAIGISVKSGDEVVYTVDENRSLAQTIDAEISELLVAWAASKSDNETTALNTKISALTATKNNLSMDNASTATYSETVTGLNNTISDAQTVIDNTSGSETPATIAEAQDNKTDAQEALDHINDNYVEDNFSYIAFQQSQLQDRIDELTAALNTTGDAATNQNMTTEIAFLNAKKAQLNTAPVDVIVVDDLFAATGNINLYADTVYGSSDGLAESKNDVSITVRNDSQNPLEVLDVEIPDDPGGTIYMNEQIVRTNVDIAALNADSGAVVAFGMTSDPDNFNPVVEISSRYNAKSSAYNPSLDTSIKSPELLLSGDILNRGGKVGVINKYGSIFQKANIQSAQLRMTSGGSLFISSPDNATRNLGPHPDAAFSSLVNPRENSPGSGSGANSLGTCGGSGEPSCSVSSATQSDENSAIAVGGKIFMVANSVNLNGLVQSGFTNKTVTIDNISDPFNAFKKSIDTNGNNVLDASEWTDRNGNGNFDLADLQGTYAIDANADNGTFNGSSGLARRVDGLYDAYYDADNDEITLSGFEASGGEVFIAGKLISTGKGQINVADGYSTYNITNNTGKKIKLESIDTGEVEGKVTLIDNFKVNSDNLSFVTQYRRLGDSLEVLTGYGAATDNSTGSFHNAAYGGENSRHTRYNPETGARYYWMAGEYVDLTKKYYSTKTTWGGWFGITFYSGTDYEPPESDLQSTAISPSALPEADYVSLDTSATSDYRFRTRFEEHSYSSGLDSDYSNNPDVSCKDYFFVKKCTTKIRSRTRITGNQYYYHDVRADRAIDIRFIGSDTGTLNVTSNAGIEISGTVKNASGTTSLTATGDITMASSESLLDVGTVTLTANNGSIGTASTKLKLAQTSGATISATAANGVFMHNDNDNMTFTALTNSDGNIDLYAGKTITLNTASNTLVGDNISLYSLYGAVRDTSGNAIRINTMDNGTVNVRSRSGDIKLLETSGDLFIDSIDVIGNAEIATSSGSILDANLLQTNDEDTQSALLGLWAELGLTGDNATTKRDNQIVAYNDSQEQLYEDYWALRNVDDNGSADAYDANFAYTASADERESIQTNTYEEAMTALYQDYWSMRNVQQGDNGSYYAETYNPAFTYTATDDEREALGNDAAAITQFELDQAAIYNQGHAKFGSGTYTPGYEYVAVQADIDNFTSDYAATSIGNFETAQTERYAAGYAAFGDAAYVDNYTHAADAAELASMTAGYEWNEEYLEAPLPGQSFKEVTDSTAFIETSNIIADNITLTAVGGNIGTFTDTATFSLSAVEAGTLDNDSKIKLMAAEADDVELNEETNMILLTQREDLDIKTLRSDSVVTINAASGYAFVGGETALNIDTVAAGGEVRLKVNGDILNVRNDTNAVVSSDALVLEAATGSLGTSAQPLYLEVSGSNKLTARAKNGVWLTEKTGDINVGQIYSPNVISLVSPGAILDKDEDSITDIKGDVVTLVAPNGFGIAPLASDNRSVEVFKALDLETVNADNSTFAMTATNGGAFVYVPGSKTARLTAVNVSGGLRIGSGGRINAQGTFTVGDDNLTMWSGTNGLVVDMTGGLSTGGTDVLMVSGGGNSEVSGSLNTGGGDLDVSVVDNITFANAAISTDNGTIAVAAGSGINQSGNMTTTGATISFYGGDNRTVDRDANVTVAGNLTTNGGAVFIQAGDNSSFDNGTWVQSASLIQSGTINSDGGAVTLKSAEDITQSGTITSNGGVVSFAAGDDETSLADADIVTSGSVSTAGALFQLTATDDAEIGGVTDTAGGNLSAQMVDNVTLAANSAITTGGGNIEIVITGRDDQVLAMNDNSSIATAGGDVTFLVGMTASDGFRQTTRMDNDSSIATGGGDFLIQSDTGLNQDFTMADRARINTGTGKIKASLSGQATVTGLTTESTGACTGNYETCAVGLFAYDVQDGGNSAADITLNSNGDIGIFSNRFTSLNRIDYTGTQALDINVQNQLANDLTLTGAVMLGIYADSGVQFNKLLTNTAAISAPISDFFEIEQGEVIDDVFITAGDMNARIGKLKQAGLNPASWLGGTGDPAFFAGGALPTGGRLESFAMTGSGSFVGDANAVLSYNFLFNDPTISGSGVITSWSQQLTLLGEEASLQRLEDRVNLTLSQALLNSGIATNILQRAATVTRFNQNVALAANTAPAAPATSQTADAPANDDAATSALGAETTTASATSAADSDDVATPADQPVLGTGNAALDASLSDTFAVRDTDGDEGGVVTLDGTAGFVTLGAAPATTDTAEDNGVNEEDGGEADEDSEQAGDDELPEDSIPLAVNEDAPETEQLSQLLP